MLTETEQNNLIQTSDTISQRLVDNSIKQINERYSENYHQQNPHLLSAFIELNKTIYLATINS